MRRPASSPPVSDTMSTSGLAASASPTRPPGPRTRLTTPAGRPASSSSSTRMIVVSGVSEAGFRTIVSPAAIAGATFQLIWSSG